MGAALTQHDVQTIMLDADDALLNAVVALADRNAHYLGHFPASCFSREADRKRLIAAVSVGRQLLGYLLYRETRARAVIQHLCVDESARSRGVARALLRALRTRTDHLPYIMLHCAKEFPAYQAWVKLGFTPEGEKPGRGRSGRALTRFVLHNVQRTLFAQADQESFDATVVAALDVNVVIELQEKKDAETLALLADWLTPEVTYWVMGESYVEVDRRDSPAERTRRKAFLNKFPRLTRDPVEEEDVFQRLLAITGHAGRVQDASDLRQLAQAIVGQADVFVTRDGDILTHADQIRQTLGLDVLRPIDLLLRFDAVLRRHDYAPQRLEGSAIEARRVREGDTERLTTEFLNTGRGETKASFARLLRECLCTGDRCFSVLIPDTGSGFRALLVAVVDGGVFRVKLFRVDRDRLSETLARHLSTLSIRQALDAGCDLVTVEDPNPIYPLDGALRATTFSIGAGRAWHWCPTGLATLGELAERLGKRAARDSSGIKAVQGTLAPLLARAPEAARDAAIEAHVWPCKLSGSSLPNFVVPIRPRHAKHLFDAQLRSSELFGSDPRLILNCENVYYRSSAVRLVRAPGRMLWYVTADEGEVPVRQLRAVSTVQATEVGPAKELFRKHEHLGVYQFRDVRELAKGDPLGEIMCIRFGLTEILPHPINRSSLAQIIQRHTGKELVLQMPIAVPSACFEDLYRAGYGNQ